MLTLKSAVILMSHRKTRNWKQYVKPVNICTTHSLAGDCEMGGRFSGGVRLTTGDLYSLAPSVSQQLQEDLRICISNDLAALISSRTCTISHVSDLCAVHVSGLVRVRSRQYVGSAPGVDQVGACCCLRAITRVE